MANTIRGQGRMLPGEDRFEFSLDGISTSEQMDRLIKLSSELLKTWDATKTGLADELDKATENLSDLSVTTTKFDDNLDKLSGSTRLLGRSFESLIHGNFKNLANEFDNRTTRIASVTGTVVGALTGYTDKLGEAMQRGISGGLFDFAIAAKTAGVSMEAFTKAIVESGGGFASLGTGATDGAKQFGLLAGQVRTATASFGNLGMTNEQLMMFTAQQTKTAISQGFKGKQAQDLVIKNSRDLAEELDLLANRTGKSVLEMAQAAMKLAQDPIVANFVKTAQRGGEDVAKSIQQFGATMRGVFGEMGDSIASDLTKSLAGNLPFSITKSGQTILLGSQRLYSEFERLSGVIRNGGNVTAEDQERLRNIALEEVQARGQELRMLANLEGAMGDSARQILALAKEAEFYNNAAGKERQQRDRVAQQFNSQLREFQANLQALTVPILSLVNAVDWTAFASVLNAAVTVVKAILWPFQKFGELLGMSNLPGTIIGGLFGLAAVAALTAAGFKTIGTISGLLAGQLGTLGASVVSLAATMRAAAAAGALSYTMGGARGLAGAAAGTAATGLAGMLPKGLAGKFGLAAGAGLLGAGATFGVAQAMGGGGAGGAVGNIAGTILGGAVGAFGGPIGIAIGSTLGGILGQWVGDSISSSSVGDELGQVGANAIGESQQLAQRSAQTLASIERGITTMVDQNGANLALTNQGNRISSDQVRATTNLSYRMG